MTSEIKSIKRNKGGTLEREVTLLITDFLRARGWRCQRQQSGLVRFRPGRRAFRVGEPGLADWICLRPLCEGVAEVFYLEVKCATGRLSAVQREWAGARRAERFEVVTAWSFDAFERWYNMRWPEQQVPEAA